MSTQKREGLNFIIFEFVSATQGFWNDRLTAQTLNFEPACRQATFELVNHNYKRLNSSLPQFQFLSNLEKVHGCFLFLNALLPLR